jgi:hypothetical protein
MISSGAMVVPLRIAVEIPSNHSGSAAEPAIMFGKASKNLPYVIVRTLCPDWTCPDRK